jgi:hypothetical protein
MANRRLDPVSYRPLRVDPLLSEGLLSVAREGGDLERRVATGLARMADEFGRKADHEAERAGKRAGEQAAMAGRPGALSVTGGETGTASVNGQAGHVRGARGGMRVTVAPAEIRKMVTDAAMRNAVDGETLLEIARIESTYDPNAKNPNSSAGGLFQFIDGTARQYGLSDRYDPAQASDAAARLMRDNAAKLRKDLGRDATPGELYLAHQQGGAGASRLLANPDALAADIVGADAVRLNGGHAGMTARQFAEKWISKVRTGGGSYSALPDASSVEPVSVTPVDTPVSIERGASSTFKANGRDTVFGRAYDVAGTRTHLEVLDAAMLQNQQAIYDAYKDDPAMLEKALGENLIADLKENVIDEIQTDYTLAYEKRAAGLISKAKTAREERARQENRISYLDRAGQLETEKSRALAGLDPNDPAAGDGIASIQGSIDAHYDSAVARGVLTPAEAADAKERSRSDTTVAWYLKQSAGKRPEEIAAMRAELAQDFSDGVLPGMSGQQFDKITTGLAAAEKARATQDRQANIALRQRGDRIAKRIASGEPVSAEDVARFQLDAGSAPDGKEIVRSTLSRMQVSDAIRTMELPELEKNLERILTIGGEKPRGEDIAFAREQIAKHRKAVEADPLGVAERFGVIPLAGTLPLEVGLTADAAEDAFGARMAAADAAADHFGVSAKYFRPDEIARVKTMIDEDPDAALTLAAGVISSAGPRAGQVLREFGDQAPGMEQAGTVLVLGGNADAARDLIAGYGKTPEGGKYKDIDATKRRPVREKTMGGAMVFDPSMAKSFEAGAAAIARKRIHDAGIDPKSEEARDVYGRALSEAAGGSFRNGQQYGGFASFDPGWRWRPKQVVVPTNVRADMFVDVVGTLADEDLGGVTAKNGRAWRARDFQNAIPVRVNGGHVFAMGDPTSANPMFIAGVDGKPIVLDFEGALGERLKTRIPEAFR